MERTKQAPEKVMFDAMKEAIAQTATDLEAQGVSCIKCGNPTPSPEGEATDEELEAVVSFFQNLL